MKKTICLVTDWYPTKDNPFRGLFFKEQAFAVKESFDFIIFRYREHIRRKPGKKYQISVINEEANTKEYLVDVNVPISVYMADVINNFKVKHIEKCMVDGIGKFVSKKRKEFTKKAITEIFEKHVCESVDVFYCVDAQNEAFRLQCLAEHFNKPYIVGEHAPVPWPGSLIQDINKYAIEKADLFFAISNDKIRQLLLQNIKLPKTVYLGNLIDETSLTIKKENGEHIPTLIIVAANSFYKNYDLFIKTMSRLMEIANKPFRVMIVGYAANKGYSKNIVEFETKIKATNFAKVTEMIPEVPHSAIGDVLRRADVFVMTSIQEGQPVSAMEAACCGLPIFSTRCGGVEDYVTDKIGRIYSVTDYNGLAEGLNDYLEGKIRFDSVYIRDEIVKRFGNKAFVNNFVKAINEVISNN